MRTVVEVQELLKELNYRQSSEAEVANLVIIKAMGKFQIEFVRQPRIIALLVPGYLIAWRFVCS